MAQYDRKKEWYFYIVKSHPEFYIGLMSGTSADGIDAALVDFSESSPKLIATYYSPYSSSLREKIHALCAPGENEIERLAEIDVLLGKAFANTVNTLLKNQAISPEKIHAIGSHGQTIRHYPKLTFTLQIGDPNIIAAETGIVTVADFRRKDLAFGGQGAPLVPAFHQQIFSAKEKNRAIVNIGGIANVTLLSPHNESVLGFDTGPGNTLLDAWIHSQQKKPYDENGDWARLGSLNQDLLHALLLDPYFKLAPPKSTGREYFNLDWLQKYLANRTISPADVQATLVELTAQSIMNAIKTHLQAADVFICGGGVHNQFLIERLRAQSAFTIKSTEEFGIPPDWVEAIAFAWLAKQTLNRQPGNLPSVTGAKKNTILGGIYY